MCKMSHMCLSTALNAYFLLEIIFTFGLPVPFKLHSAALFYFICKAKSIERGFVLHKIHYFAGRKYLKLNLV